MRVIKTKELLLSHDEGQEQNLSDTEEQTKVREPSMYSVYLLNDDFTTQEFVIQVLVQFFYKSENEAEQIMLKVHNEGKGKAGTFTKDVAETKVYLVHQAAKENKYPLKCTMEPE